MSIEASDVDSGPEWASIRAQLIAHSEQVRNDEGLLQALGLKIAHSNVVEFGPAALTRLEHARIREMTARQEIEAVARANFAAQAQTHAMAVDLLEARNNADLARRVKALAKTRRTSANRVVVDLIEAGLDAQEQEKKRFFDLADRLVNTSDHKEQQRIKEELARLTFGE